MISLQHVMKLLWNEILNYFFVNMIIVPIWMWIGLQIGSINSHIINRITRLLFNENFKHKFFIIYLSNISNISNILNQVKNCNKFILVITCLRGKFGINLLSSLFWNFEMFRVKRGRFQNFRKWTRWIFPKFHE